MQCTPFRHRLYGPPMGSARPGRDTIILRTCQFDNTHTFSSHQKYFCLLTDTRCRQLLLVQCIISG